MNVGALIKEYLDAHRISQVWLSVEAGIPTAKLNLALSGKRRMKFDEYALICGALDVDTNMFLKPMKRDGRIRLQESK